MLVNSAFRQVSHFTAKQNFACVENFLSKNFLKGQSICFLPPLRFTFNTLLNSLSCGLQRFSQKDFQNAFDTNG
jgi:hypothetical protein